MKMTLALVSGISIALILSTTAPAQPPVGLEFHGSYGFGIKDYDGDLGELEFSDPYGLGFAATLCNLSPNLQIDFGVDYYSSKENNADKRLSMVPIYGALRFGGKVGSFYLYGGGGIGYSINSYDEFFDTFEWKLDSGWIYFVCGGAEYALSPQVGIRTELRYNWLRPELEKRGEFGHIEEDDNVDLSHAQIRAGVVIYL